MDLKQVLNVALSGLLVVVEVVLVLQTESYKFQVQEDLHRQIWEVVGIVFGVILGEWEWFA
jgi:hypothetical protein